MLKLPFKDTKNVSLAQPLKTYIQENLQPEPNELNAANLAADELDTLRVKYYAALRAGESTPLIKQHFLSYIQRLKTLAVRFPFGENVATSSIFGLFGDKGGDSTSKRLVSIPFSYTDQFNQAKWVNSYNLNFEIANVIINYANALTRAASQLFDPNVDATINDTCQLYKEAATLYQFISNQSDITTLGLTLTPSLSFETLNAISLACLAQAQSLFPEKAMLKQSSASIIATLSAGAAKTFEDSYTAALASPSTKVYLSSDSYNFLSFLQFQRLYWLATANLWYGKTQFDTAHYGDEIAYLYCSKTALIESQHHNESINKICPKLLQLRNQLAITINGRIQMAEKDNSSIYFAKIPSEVKLVTPRVMADFSTVIVEGYFEAPVDQFSMLVDPQLRQQILSTQRELEGMVDAIERGVKSIGDQARAELHSMNLPGALEAIDNGNQLNNTDPARLVPEDLWTKLTKVHSNGGLEHLDRLLERTKQGQSYILTKVNEFRTSLNKEASDDNQLRTQHGAQRWSRQQSDQLIKPMLESCSSIEKLAQDAAKADTTCFNEFNQLKLELGPMLRMDRNILGQNLPRPAQTNNQLQNKPFVVELRTLIQQLSNLISERDTKISSARTLLASLLLKLRQQLGASPNREQFLIDLRETLHKELLPLHGESQIPKQTELLKHIAIANRAFNLGIQSLNDTAIQQQSKQFQDSLQKYYAAINNYSRVSKHLEEGVRFYQDLINDTINPLQQRTNDYIMARDMEKKMWIEDLNAAFNRMSMQTQQQQQQQHSQQYYNQGSYSASAPPPQQYHPPQPQYQQPQAYNSNHTGYGYPGNNQQRGYGGGYGY